MTSQETFLGDSIDFLFLPVPFLSISLALKGNLFLRDRKGCCTLLSILVTRLFFVLTSYSNCILVIANIGTGRDICTSIAPRTSSCSRWNRIRAKQLSTTVLNFIGQINKLILYTVHGNKTSNNFANLIRNVIARSFVILCFVSRIIHLRQLHRHRHLRIVNPNDSICTVCVSLNISPSIGRLGTAVVGTADGKLNDELLATSLIVFTKTTPVFREVETGNGD